MKNARHAEILRLIKENRIETQEELAEYLNAEGYQVTQATVSRDIRELHLTKISAQGGRSYYSIMQNQNEHMSKKYSRVLSDAFVSMDVAGNLLVIKTVAGMAMAAGAALDALGWAELVGCIAGDDTIMCATRSAQDAKNVMIRLKKLIHG